MSTNSVQVHITSGTLILDDGSSVTFPPGEMTIECTSIFSGEPAATAKVKKYITKNMFQEKINDITSK